jgi:acyl-[acyl-carrier-protein]-phospholipid O-acyltransferase/long-chain-fatty-acid--[acyl-carrier-protein] ligase
MQAWASADMRARVVAAANVLNAAFMVVGSFGVALLQKAGIGIPVLFLALGIANMIVALLIALTMPAKPLSDLQTMLAGFRSKRLAQ